jgi:hypothetical protein
VRFPGSRCSSPREIVVYSLYGLLGGKKETQRCIKTYSILCTTTDDKLADTSGDSRFFDIYASPGTLALEMRGLRTADNFSFLTTIL